MRTLDFDAIVDGLITNLLLHMYRFFMLVLDQVILLNSLVPGLSE